jgi:hypothetical protein
MGVPLTPTDRSKLEEPKQRQKVKLERSSSFPRKWEPAVAWRASYQQGEIAWEMSLF